MDAIAFVPSPRRNARDVQPELSPFRLMAQIMSQQLTALSRSLRPVGITGPMSRILTGLRETGDATIAELAEHSGFERSYVSRLLDQLSRSGLVERVPDPLDRRQRLMRLTATGRQRQQQAAALVARLTATHLRTLSAHEITRLRELLERIYHSYRSSGRD
jgi:DNA-binding MarR family transcriptional regulator